MPETQFCRTVTKFNVKRQISALLNRIFPKIYIKLSFIICYCIKPIEAYM